MAFGFFKKAEKADKVYINGKFYTQNGEQPWVEAVACKDGKILAIGGSDAMQELADSDAEIVDLEGAYVMPGFIDINGHPAFESIKDSLTVIEDAEDLDSVLGTIANSCDGGFFDDESKLFFVKGRIFSEEEEVSAEAIRKAVSERSEEVPAVVIFADHGLIVPNDAAAEAIKAFAEENQIAGINFYVIMEALNLIDFEEVQQQAINLAKDYCEKGYTSVVNNGDVEYFNSVYTDIQLELLENGMLKQRTFDRTVFSAPCPEQLVQASLQRKMVKFQELGGKINQGGLLVNMEGKFEYEEDIDQLLAMCKAAAEAGFDVKLNADSDEEAKDALGVLTALYGKYRKNTFTLAHHTEFEETERLDSGLGREILEAPPVAMNYLAGKEPASVSEAVDILTIGAAEELGVLDTLGSIEEGKQADFAVFEENPLDAPNLKMFGRCRAKMTVVAGDVVYDEDEDVANEWYEILVKQQY